MLYVDFYAMIKKKLYITHVTFPTFSSNQEGDRTQDTHGSTEAYRATVWRAH